MYKDELKTIVYNIINRMEKTILSEIHKIICDNTLSDFECIEKIVEIFNENGFSCSSRHDF